MNKNFFSFCMILLSLISVSYSNISISLESKSKNITREFFTSYMQAFRGKDWVMNKDCLSGQFDDMSKELISSIEERNWIRFGLILYSIIRLEMKDCPIDDIKGILNDLRTSIKNGTSYTNILKNHEFIETELKNYLNSEKSANAFGSFIGRFTKIVVYGDIRFDIKEESSELHSKFDSEIISNFLS